jgi:hypothetical protein
MKGTPLLSPYNLNFTNHTNANNSPIIIKPDCLPAPWRKRS